MALRVLITGAGGMVGKNLLSHKGIDQWDVLSPSRAELNLKSFDLVKSAIQSFRPDFVIHLAGRVGGIGAHKKWPVAFFLDNLDLGRNVIMAAYESGVPKLLNIASAAIYPEAAISPLSESTMLSGSLDAANEGYALSKIMAAKLCEYIMQQSGSNEFSYKTLVPCNIYGPYDHFNEESSHLIPAVIKRIHSASVARANEVSIWGDGQARREFMYAGDLADAIVHAVNNFNSMPARINVGWGSDHSVLEYYQAIASEVGWNGAFVFDRSKPIGRSRRLLDVSLQTAWGWQPSINLSSGIRQTYQYFLQELA
ncbi:MAG: NAD-dependent epimerase/dehydratase family protein [Stagnimonas sp.]|nr:NAD-dependent epimerase/dehydratase family protein [Stagnimonas sp.]